MKHAILLLAHNNPAQLARLISALDCDCFDFFIHIDQKVPSSIFKKAITTSKSSVCFVDDSKRRNIVLNDFSLVDATCELMKTALQSSIANQKEYLYYILLTGQDYPIKNISSITRQLEDNYPLAYIDSYSVYEARQHKISWVEHVGHSFYSQRCRRLLLKCCGRSFYYSQFGKVVKVIPKILDFVNTKLKGSPRQLLQPTGYEYSVGSHFWMLPDIAVEFILDRYAHDEQLNDIFHNIAAPEESYFQTVISAMGNKISIPDPWTQFSSQIAEMDNPALRLIKWYENGKHTNGHPAIWRKSDFDTISNARALFGRKFNSQIDSEILTLIDERILNK